jgi:hypothetical protein
MRAILPASWQEINEGRHFCHWWRDVDQRKLTAMLLLLILVLTLVIVGIGGWAADSRDPDYSLWPCKRPGADR